MQNNTGTSYTFRDVVPQDEGLLAHWLSQQHVRRWWPGPEESLAEIRAAMTDPSTRPMIVLVDERPVGYVQVYDPHLEPDHPYGDQPPGMRGIDQFIGPAELLGKGHGPAFIRNVCGMLFAQGVTRVVTDPDPENAAAIKAYGKAGFTSFDRRETIFGPVLMMKRDAA